MMQSCNVMFNNIPRSLTENLSFSVISLVCCQNGEQTYKEMMCSRCCQNKSIGFHEHKRCVYRWTSSLWVHVHGLAVITGGQSRCEYRWTSAIWVHVDKRDMNTSRQARCEHRWTSSLCIQVENHDENTYCTSAELTLFGRFRTAVSVQWHVRIWSGWYPWMHWD